MKLVLINPNTTDSMTETMLAASQSVANPDTVVVGETAAYGPESIEGYYDEVFCVPPLVDAVNKHGDTNGIIIGCFDDTGVDALRCMGNKPTIGLCQAAMQTATVLAGSFSVITTLGRSVPALEHLALRHGFERQCKRVRASDVPVLALEQQQDEALNQIRREIRLAIDQDRAEAIVLGCAGMANLAADLSTEFGLPVVEGVTAATKIVESLVCLDLHTTSLGGYENARPKIYSGEFKRFEPQD